MVQSFPYLKMKNENKQTINSKLDELTKYLNIDTNENSWEYDLLRALKATTTYTNVFRIIGQIIMGGSIVIALIALGADGGTVLGIEVKEIYFPVFLVIGLLSNLFISHGKMELKKERIKTFLLLKDLSNEKE